MLSKKIFTFILSASICASFTACDSNSKQASTPKDTNIQIKDNENSSEKLHTPELKEDTKENDTINNLDTGNTISNLNNSGIAALGSEWIYYISKKNNNYSLYKKKTDNSSETKICDDASLSINIVGDYIYYTTYGYIYKIKTDGTDRKQIYEEKVNQIYVVDDFIYYQKMNDMKIYKFNITNNETFKVSDDVAEHGKFFINGEWIYYSSNGLHKVKIDGSEKSTLTNDECHFTTIVDNAIYYSSNDTIYKMNLDGSNKQEIFNEEALAWLNITNDYIYFSNINNGGIYRLNLDGTEKTKISDDYAYKINIADNWLYYDYAKRPMDFKWIQLN
ncbi:DUF5050 domain-containing protein [Oceanirhabdus seepicola]|uniref:DUF5050 domain-containing protein n=1 Tax=Oceanirhabdus seepicola TaxID=2828781 RepID=A0A9J6NXD7_9CLOT|nr:DUF5050 domain-containing protein [Oceanirhabdus seepicola]MCM1988561.1 DUF5050 domain-containing protein [Oceanirhabdus seepicola]